MVHPCFILLCNEVMIPSAQSVGKVPAFNISASRQKTSPDKCRVAFVGRFGIGDRFREHLRDAKTTTNTPPTFLMSPIFSIFPSIFLETWLLVVFLKSGKNSTRYLSSPYSQWAFFYSTNQIIQSFSVAMFPPIQLFINKQATHNSSL